MSSELAGFERAVYEQFRNSDGIYYLILNQQLAICDVSPNFIEIVQRPFLDIYKRRVDELPVHPIGKDQAEIDWSETELIRRFIRKRKSGLCILSFQTSQGDTYCFKVEVSFRDKECALLMTDFRELLDLRANEKLLSELFHFSNEAIVLVDKENRLVRVNPAFERITGYSSDEACGLNPSFLSSGAHNSSFYERMWDEIRQSNRWSGVLVNRRKSGELYSEHLTIRALTDVNGEITSYIGIFSEVDQVDGLSDKEKHLQELDILTALPKRTLLIDRLEQAVAYARRHDFGVAVIYFDIDHFSEINESFGKTVGDKVLQLLSGRLHSTIRQDDVLARYGGDEFVVVLRDLEKGFNLQGFVERLVDQIQAPLEIEGTTLNLTASLGVTQFPADDSSPETLIRHADHSMSIAKSYGRANFVFYSQKHEQDRKRMLQKRDRILRAIEAEELCLFAQPQFNMHNEKLFGLEFLIRWQSPEQGLLLPDKFLTEIKDKALLQRVDEWVVLEAIHQIETQFSGDSYQNVKFGINLTPASLQSVSFHKWLESTLIKAGKVISARLEFEILETDALENLDLVRTLIFRLEKLKVSFSLDDFGTGYSSLSIFNQLPVQSVKIDRTFVDQMVEDHRNLSLIRAICEMSKIFDRNIIAEGVEFKEQAHLLTDIGCNIVQGYGLFRPAPVDEVARVLKDHSIDSEWSRR